MKPINSINDLARRIGIPRGRLWSIAANISDHYDEWALQDKKIPGKFRQVRSPRGELMKIQRLLNERIFSLIPLNENVQGGLRGRSTRTNAEAHLGQPCVITLDVKQFYDRVRHEMVYQLFRRELGFGRDVAGLLTRLTTYNDALPQGAPTSLAVANLLLTSPLDNPLSIEAKQMGVTTTRFVDDIALSGLNPRPFPRPAPNEAASVLRWEGAFKPEALLTACCTDARHRRRALRPSCSAMRPMPAAAAGRRGLRDCPGVFAECV